MSEQDYIVIQVSDKEYIADLQSQLEKSQSRVAQLDGVVMQDETDITSLQSENAQLQAELARLTAEHALAVRVAVEYLDRYDGVMSWMYLDDEQNGAITWGDVKQVQRWKQAADSAPADHSERR